MPRRGSRWLDHQDHSGLGDHEGGQSRPRGHRLAEGRRFATPAYGNVGLVARDALNLKGDLPDFARTGARLGEVVARVDGEKSGESPLIAMTGYGEASLGDRVWYTVEGIFAEEK